LEWDDVDDLRHTVRRLDENKYRDMGVVVVAVAGVVVVRLGVRKP
jgi:hypothetical protein